MTWILLVLVYGVLKGTREIAKKKAMEKSSILGILVFYTFLSFLLVLPQAPQAAGLEPKYFFFIALKAFSIFLAWIFSCRALKKLPVSLYGILDLSRVLFSTFLGVTLLGEIMTPWQIAGLVIVCIGLLMLKLKPETAGETTEKSRAVTGYVLLALVSCMLNAVSSFLDKVLLKDISSAQLQFWYILFLFAFYLLDVIITREKIDRSIWKNGWIWLMAVIFVIGDRALFIANANPDSKLTIITLVKQSACIVTILGGKFIFKEKNIAYRLICAAVVIAGIVIGVM